MTQPFGGYHPNFFYENSSSCREIAKSLDSFHKRGMKRSDTYRDMVHAVFQLGEMDVYVRDQLKHGSQPVIWFFDSRSNTYLIRVEISRRAFEAVAGKIPKEEHPDVTTRLAISSFIGVIRKVLRFSTSEIPVGATGRHETKDDMDIALKREPNGFSFPDPEAVDVLKASTIDVISCICQEIREHYVLF
ncbi:hypothetical protein FPOAC2_13831 [Fusarium poae]|jgi:hypothetical protein|uniref:uncharacterized protein n=1 Tax=Fusarium poae TaxID=36050 RepID=UPI001D039A76|nr:uncharacterized protein FPOAC1_012843 [Fusarium poae]KAG8664866.1 hypothetical protein FPOAC1_012843 [Fusarium poae]